MNSFESLLKMDTFVISAHRGWSSEYPENTLIAFEQAMKFGADVLEFDMRLSKDGEVVIIHDERVDRTTNGNGEVREMTVKELRQLDAGGWKRASCAGVKIPTLEQLCELMQQYPHVSLMPEFKTSPDAKQTIDKALTILQDYKLLNRCVFVSFDASMLAYLTDMYGQKVQGFSKQQMLNFKDGSEGTYEKMWSVGIPMNLLDRNLVNDFRSRGKHPWSYCPDTDEEVYYSLGCGIKLMTVNDLVPPMRIRNMMQTMS